MMTTFSCLGEPLLSRSSPAIIKWTGTIATHKGFILDVHKFVIVAYPLNVSLSFAHSECIDWTRSPRSFMVVLINIFAHNLSLTHSFKKQRIDSVHRSLRSTSAGCGRLVWALFCLQLDHIRSFCLRCLRYQREVSLQVLAGLCNGQVLSAGCRPRGCIETQRSRRVPAQTPGHCVLLQGRAAGETGKDRLQMWAVQKEMDWGIIFASAAEARCQASSKHAHLLVYIWPWCPPSAPLDQWSQSAPLLQRDSSLGLALCEGIVNVWKPISIT